MKSILLLTLFLFSSVAQARLEITITEGVEGALPIAIVPFTSEARVSDDIAAIVADDLARSGRFLPLARDKLPPLSANTTAQPDYPLWRRAGVENLLIGSIRSQAGRHLVQFQLFDTVRGTQLLGFSIPAESGTLRRIAHQIADLVYEKLIGQPGAFNTHIAYVMVERSSERTTWRLAVADSDGHNEQIILTSQQPLMSPAWAPDGRRLAYVSFESGRSAIFVQEVTTGNRDKIAEFKGLNSAPSWSPDGRHLAFTLSRDGNPEIYTYDLATRVLQRITQHYAIDTEATWGVDGKTIYFTSDRGGKPQIYRQDLLNGRPAGVARRVTFEGGYNARASFAPDGRQMTFITQVERGFQVATYDLATRQMRTLTDSRMDESPSYAPNGAMIIYATEEKGRGILSVVSADGRSRQRLGVSNMDVREPAWSPHLTKRGNP
jgi:TolB protein